MKVGMKILTLMRFMSFGAITRHIWYLNHLQCIEGFSINKNSNYFTQLLGTVANKAWNIYEQAVAYQTAISFSRKQLWKMSNSGRDYSWRVVLNSVTTLTEHLGLFSCLSSEVPTYRPRMSCKGATGKEACSSNMHARNAPNPFEFGKLNSLWTKVYNVLCNQLTHLKYVYFKNQLEILQTERARANDSDNVVSR